MCPPGEEASHNKKPVDEYEVEERLSERLVQGCMLLEASCPACVTPLVKQTDDGPSDDNSLMMGQNRHGSKSRQYDHITPIEGVPFCVACPCHVITNPAEAEKVEQNLNNLNEKVLVTYEMEEPEYTNKRRSLADDMSDVLSESQKRRGRGSGSPTTRLRARIWKAPSSVKSRKSKKSDSSGSHCKSKSSIPTGIELQLEETEIEHLPSSNNKKGLGSKSPKNNKNGFFQRISPTSTAVEEEDNYTHNGKDVVEDEKRQEQNIKKEHKKEQRCEDDVEASVCSKIDEINVQKYCSVDAEDLTTADVLTLVESEDEMVPFEEK
jgi:hypothetical protein